MCDIKLSLEVVHHITWEHVVSNTPHWINASENGRMESPEGPLCQLERIRDSDGGAV